jgi:fermentation-respiration switch protein FrsA (DUF1100 family)
VTQRGGCSLSVTVLVTAKVADVDAVVHVQDARGASAACTALIMLVIGMTKAGRWASMRHSSHCAGKCY